MIPTEIKNTILFKQRLLPNYLPHDLEIVTARCCQFYMEAEKNSGLFYSQTTYSL